MVVGLQLPVQSVPITTKIVSLTHPDTCHSAFDTTLFKVFSSADDGHVSHDEFKDYFTQVNLHFINDVITIKIKVLFSHVTIASLFIFCL
jgi:hypothetical protein